jgi:hypothetical protein
VCVAGSLLLAGAGRAAATMPYDDLNGPRVYGQVELKGITPFP